MERNEKEREKEMTKRKKRATRGRRGVALPDREPIKTLRTPAIGFPDVDPAVLALAQAAAAPTSRRAAAAAASLTIANMVASENGTAVITPTLPMATPSAPIPSVPKEKKTKGLFKPPSYPPTILHPRANVSAPTMSTAADASKLPPPLENDPPAPMPVPPPQDNRLPRVISAKRAKELEREAKEKEFADGQHPNFINGVWHCSNCGCPEDIAIGRRKGPLGDKSQCGTCGMELRMIISVCECSDNPRASQVNSGIATGGQGLSCITQILNTTSACARRLISQRSIPKRRAALLRALPTRLPSIRTSPHLWRHLNLRPLARRNQ